MIKDLEHYGLYSRKAATKGSVVSSDLAATWRARLISSSASHLLSEKTMEPEWPDALFLGQRDFMLTGRDVY